MPDFITNEIFQIFLVFCRVGTCMMLMTGFGDSHVTPRLRLVVAMALSLIITPLLTNIPRMPGAPVEALVYIFSEIVFGFMIGTITKIIASAIHVGGMIIGMQSSLSQSSLFDPNQGSQGSVFGTFMDLTALVLLFALDLHHMLLAGIYESYNLFAPGSDVPYGDFADSATQLVAHSFLVGVQLSAPLIIIGILVNLASGILSRLMPQFQVFFVIMPAQILVSFFIFLMTFSAMMLWYIEYFETSFRNMMMP